MSEEVVVGGHEVARQATSDGQVVAMWLHDKAAHTQRAYGRDIRRFFEQAAKPLQQVTLGDVQAYADSLSALAPSSQARMLAATKSLLGFAHRIGYLAFDVGAAVQLPHYRETLAQRILTETQVQAMVALEPNRRNRLMLRLMYAAGLRVSEVCALSWGDVQEQGDSGSLVVFGKGGKTRVVLLGSDTYHALISLRKDAPLEGPVFVSRRGGHLDSSQVLRIVQVAAKRAGIEGRVSPHWLRHSHASHALDRGCPIHLVQATLGHASVATTSRYLHARPQDSSARYLAL